MLTVKKKDTVVINTGKDKGKKGEVLKVYIETNKVIVSKINFVKRHKKPTQNEPGGIREKEAPVPISNVMLICPKCAKPTRPKFDTLFDGKKVRVCRKCGEMII
ncbi:MAG: 50S ribosomal protein L24 [Endomicrobiales bacterium]|nr:50S ribosomal protein L24 [Endomicrobiales bacterium]